MRAPCLCLSRGDGIAGGWEVHKNNAVPVRDAWWDCPGWGNPCSAVCHSGPHPAVFTPLEETWGISAVSNLKTIHASKYLQDQTRQGKGIQTYVSVYRVRWTAVAAVCSYGLSPSCPAENKTMPKAFQTSLARKPLRLQWCRHPCW